MGDRVSIRLTFKISGFSQTRVWVLLRWTVLCLSCFHRGSISPMELQFQFRRLRYSQVLLRHPIDTDCLPIDTDIQARDMSSSNRFQQLSSQCACSRQSKAVASALCRRFASFPGENQSLCRSWHDATMLAIRAGEFDHPCK